MHISLNLADILPTLLWLVIIIGIFMWHQKKIFHMRPLKPIIPKKIMKNCWNRLLKYSNLVISMWPLWQTRLVKTQRKNKDNRELSVRHVIWQTWTEDLSLRTSNRNRFLDIGEVWEVYAGKFPLKLDMCNKWKFFLGFPTSFRFSQLHRKLSNFKLAKQYQMKNSGKERFANCNFSAIFAALLKL